MDMVPKETREPEEENTYLSDRAVFAKNLSQMRNLGRKPLSKKERGLAALHDVFELIGGVPRFAIHADENPDQFYHIYFKYTQVQEKTINTNVRVIAPSIPPTALDGVTDVDFKAVTPAAEASDAGASGE